MSTENWLRNRQKRLREHAQDLVARLKHAMDRVEGLRSAAPSTKFTSTSLL